MLWQAGQKREGQAHWGALSGSGLRADARSKLVREPVSDLFRLPSELQSDR